MNDFLGKLTKAGELHKISITKTIMEETGMAAGKMITFEVRKATPPYQVIIPTLQTKIKRFGREIGVSVPSIFVITGILHRHTIYKLRIVENKLS